MLKLLILLLVAFSAKSSPQQNYAILSQDSNVNSDGTYHWSYETENGIVAQEQGGPKQTADGVGTAAQGSFQYSSPEGEAVSLQYVADENGFQPQGSHLPTPPPIPPEIQRAIQWIAANPQPERIDIRSSFQK